MAVLVASAKYFNTVVNPRREWFKELEKAAKEKEKWLKANYPNHWVWQVLDQKFISSRPEDAVPHRLEITLKIIGEVEVTKRFYVKSRDGISGVGGSGTWSMQKDGSIAVQYVMAGSKDTSKVYRVIKNMDDFAKEFGTAK